MYVCMYVNIYIYIVYTQRDRTGEGEGERERDLTVCFVSVFNRCVPPSPRQSGSWSTSTCRIYIHIYICVCKHIYIYIHVNSKYIERDGERERHLTVWLCAQMRTAFAALERLLEYLDLPQEPPHVLPTDPPPEQWPTAGKIEFRDLCMRYRVGLPLALHGFSATIEPRTKARQYIAICQG